MSNRRRKFIADVYIDSDTPSFDELTEQAKVIGIHLQAEHRAKQQYKAHLQFSKKEILIVDDVVDMLWHMKHAQENSWKALRLMLTEESLLLPTEIMDETTFYWFEHMIRSDSSLATYSCISDENLQAIFTAILNQRNAIKVIAQSDQVTIPKSKPDSTEPSSTHGPRLGR